MIEGSGRAVLNWLMAGMMCCRMICPAPISQIYNFSGTEAYLGQPSDNGAGLQSSIQSPTELGRTSFSAICQLSELASTVNLDGISLQPKT